MDDILGRIRRILAEEDQQSASGLAEEGPRALAHAEEGRSPPWWPIVVAPLIGLIYYLEVLTAFSTAIREVVTNTSDLDRMVGVVGYRWGTHWIYHLIAEAASITFATFVAGGIARERAKLAGLIGGLGISLLLVALISLAVVYGTEFVEPSYQYLISGTAWLLAPIVGYQLGAAARQLSISEARGFAGIPRANFIWLWIPTYFYAVAMIGPFLNYTIYSFIFDNSTIIGVLLFIVHLFPLICFVIPLFVGLRLLSGKLLGPTPMHPAARHLVAVLVLVVGWCLAAAIQYGIAEAAEWLTS